LGISRIQLRHCERSEAIQSVAANLDCFVASLLAMTASRRPEMTFLKPVRNVTFAKFFPPNTNDLEFP
jgi:hypothetical protein